MTDHSDSSYPVQNTYHNAYSIIVIAATAGLAYGFYADAGFEPLVFKIGFFLPTALVGWIVLYAVSLRKLPGWYKAGAFVAIYITMFIGSSVSELTTASRVAEGRSEIEMVFAEAIDGSRKANETGSEFKFDPGPTVTTGDVGAVESFAKDHMKAMVDMRNQYLNNVDAIGWATLLDPQRMAADTDLRDSQSLIDRARSIAREYQESFRTFVNETPQRIDALDLPEKSKRTLREGFANGIRNSQSGTDRIFEIERQIIDVSENLVHFLRDNRDGWAVENKQILFADQGLLDQYNQHLGRIDSLWTEQLEILRAQGDRAKDALRYNGSR